MSEANIAYTKQVVGTGALAISSDYKPLRNSGSDDLWVDWIDWILQYHAGTGDFNLDPYDLEGFEQFTMPGWDGEGATPVLKADLDSARRLLKRIAPYLPVEPDAAAGTDGSICMEWRSETAAGSKKIFVDVAPGGTVLTYSRLGNSPPSERHFKRDDPALIVYLRYLFVFFATA